MYFVAMSLGLMIWAPIHYETPARIMVAAFVERFRILALNMRQAALPV
jgi:hypothetical protein